MLKISETIYTNHILLDIAKHSNTCIPNHKNNASLLLCSFMVEMNNEDTPCTETNQFAFHEGYQFSKSVKLAWSLEFGIRFIPCKEG